jgi:hypothetical protein
MSKRLIVALTVGLAIPAFVLSRVIWPDPPGTAAPPPGLLPLLMVPAIFEALAFGAGIAFLISAGRALVRRQADRLSVAAYVSAAWALVSWWPHSNMHRANTTLEGLVLIDWTFHLTLIVGAVVIGTYLYTTIVQQRTVAVDRGTHAAPAQARP